MKRTFVSALIGAMLSVPFLLSVEDVHVEIKKFYAAQRMSSLMHAVIWGNKELVEELLKDPQTNVNFQDADGQNALMELVARVRGPRYWSFQKKFADFKKGAVEIAKLLIDKGIDLNARDKNGYTALMYAAMNGHKALANVILDQLKKKVDLKLNVRGYYDKKSAVLLTAEYGHKDILVALVLAGADWKRIKDPRLLKLLINALKQKIEEEKLVGTPKQTIEGTLQQAQAVLAEIAPEAKELVGVPKQKIEREGPLQQVEAIPAEIAPEKAVPAPAGIPVPPPPPPVAKPSKPLPARPVEVPAPPPPPPVVKPPKKEDKPAAAPRPGMPGVLQEIQARGEVAPELELPAEKLRPAAPAAPQPKEITEEQKLRAEKAKEEEAAKLKKAMEERRKAIAGEEDQEPWDNE